MDDAPVTMLDDNLVPLATPEIQDCPLAGCNCVAGRQCNLDSGLSECGVQDPMGAELAAQSTVSARLRREAAAEAAHLNSIADASLDWVRSFTYDLSEAGSILCGYYSKCNAVQMRIWHMLSPFTFCFDKVLLTFY